MIDCEEPFIDRDIKFYVTDDDFANIVRKAIYSTSYWALPWSDELIRGGESEIVEIENVDNHYGLTRKVFNRGLLMFLTEMKRNGELDRYLNSKSVVANAVSETDADAIVQYALFSEIRYAF